MQILSDTNVSSLSTTSASSDTTASPSAHAAQLDLCQSFYNALLLRRKVDSGGALRRHVSHRSESKWHNFLDALALLGDYAHGGRSVTSVAIESEARYNTCWVSTNGRLKPKVLHHLIDVVQSLKKVPSLLDTERKGLEDGIVSRSLALSMDKVSNYRRLLFVYVRILTEKLRDSNSVPVKHVLDSLTSLKKRKLDHLEFCALIYNFRKSLTMQLLDECCNDSHLQEWSYVRHYIGRLCAWRTAAKTLIDGAVRFQHLIQNLVVAQVPVTSSPTIPIRTNLPFETLLRAVVPDIDSGLVTKALNMREQLTRQGKTKAARAGNASSSSQLSLHAEVSMAEHFYRNNRVFVGNDAYIGCSKPSCYCCDMYLRNHPYNFAPRSCHGNIWTKWRVPVISSGQGEGVLEQHVQDNLNSMIRQLCQEIFGELVFNRRREKQLPDSATQLSYSVTKSGL